jgi:hypothetical protein
MRASRLCLLLLAFGAGCDGCTAGNEDETGAGGASNEGGGPPGAGTGGDTFGVGGGGGGGPVDDCLENAKLIYVLDSNYALYSFDPNIPGTAAYKLVGPLSCPSQLGAPQSMAVDRSGTAFVFYDSGELFRVSTLDASCAATPYVHPIQGGFNQLGMGFTATVPDSPQETLYINSPNFGLATVDTATYAVTQTGALAATAELTGGPDARLFRFQADMAQLDEVGIGSWGLTPIHTFNELFGTSAFAFSRYAGRFYMFTSNGFSPTTTTEYDPDTNIASTRDANVGFTIVGAGQSTCVPPPPAE